MDANDFAPKGQKPKGSNEALDRRWWDLNDEDAPASVTAILGSLKQAQSLRLTQLMVSARLYGNLPVMGMAGLSLDQLAASQAALRERIAYNAVQSVIDTAQSKMAKNKPKPLFLTSGGDYKAQRKAKKLNQFVDGIFYENKAHEDGIEVFRDGCIFGDGQTHVFAKNGRVCFERVLSSELWVDELEGLYRKPRSLHRVRQIDRDQLLAFAKSLGHGTQSKVIGAIKEASPDEKLTGAKVRDPVSDMVTVRESWHLPSREPDANAEDEKSKRTDGRHAITIDGATLLMEDWRKPFFPFARFQWSPRLWGYWGQGIAEQIQSIQVEINKLLWVIQRTYHLLGTAKVWLPIGSKISKEHVNNDIGTILEGVGDKPPQYLLPSMVPPEMYAHLDKLIQRAYEQPGVSTMDATSTKPAGLNSGKALREFADISTDRFLTPGQRYQNYYLELARLSISVVKDLVADGGKESNYEVKAPTSKFLKTIKWNDVSLEDDAYVMQCFPVSSLPTDPAGRLQTIQEYIQAGFLTPRQGRRLLDFPDLEAVESLATAEEDWLNEVMEKMTDDGVFTPPEPFDDLKLALELCAETYARGKTQNLEESRLELLRRYMAQVGDLQAAADQEAQAQMMAANPQAVPEAPPVSDLLPNAPQVAA